MNVTRTTAGTILKAKVRNRNLRLVYISKGDGGERGGVKEGNAFLWFPLELVHL